MVLLQRLPIDGECLALCPPGHAAGAYDLIGVRGESRALARRGLGWALWRLPADAFHGWRRSVVAPDRGIVRVVRDDVADRRTVSAARDLLNGLLLRPLLRGRDVAAMVGNHVIIEVGGVHVLLAHLRRRSVTVRPGDEVSAGDAVAEVGNSGNTVAPHLHVQVMTSADVLRADVIPWRLASYERWSGSDWRLVEHAPPQRSVIRAPV